MNWFRRPSAGASVQQKAAQTPTPTPAPAPPQGLPEEVDDALPEELQSECFQESEDVASQGSDDLSSSVSEYDSNLEELLRLPNMSLDAPARGVKRQAEEDEMDIDDEDPSFEYNSSGVCPEDSARHNQRVTKRPPIEHLLHLPKSIQRRIYSYVLVSDTPYQVAPDGKMLPKPVVYWKIPDDRSLTKKELRKHNGNAVCKPPGLLTACKQIRKLARDIFYVGNAFEVQIGDFDGKAIMEWWKRVSAVRSIYSAEPIMLAGRHPEPRPSILWPFRRYRERLTRLRPGNIELKVAYEPNWDNLVTWLNLCIMDRLPVYRPSNLCQGPDGYRLQTVAWLFGIVNQYSRKEWQAFDKAIDTHLHHLIRDDPRWSQFPDLECSFGDARESYTEEAGRAGTFTFPIMPASARGTEQDSPSSSHTMFGESPDHDTAGPSTSASHNHIAGVGWDGIDLGGSEDEGEYEPDEEGDDGFEIGEEDDGDSELSDLTDISDSITDDMDVDDGHRHKRRKFSSVVQDSEYGSDCE